MIHAELRGLESPDISDLENFKPNGPFGFLLTALVGPSNQKGGETFDIFVCTPDWFLENMSANIKPGRHILFVKNYDFDSLEKFIRNFCSSSSGENWKTVAEKIGRIGKWEFEDYRE